MHIHPWAGRDSNRRNSPQRNRRPRPDEDCTGVPYPARHLRSVAGLNLKVFSAIGVDDIEALLDITNQDDRTLRDSARASATRAECFVSSTIVGNTARTESASDSLSVTNTDAAMTSCPPG